MYNKCFLYVVCMNYNLCRSFIRLIPNSREKDEGDEKKMFRVVQISF